MAGPSITRYRGDTVPDEFTVLDSNGSPVNLSGFTVTMTLDERQKPNDVSTQLYELTGTITNPTGGVVEFAPSTLQADQAPGTYYYDIQLIDGSSRIETICVGTYTYIQDIGKST